MNRSTNGLVLALVMVMKLYSNVLIKRALVLSIFLTAVHANSQDAVSCSKLFSEPNDPKKSSRLSVEEKGSKTIRLFNEKGDPVEKYHERIKNLRPGDQLDFGHKNIFTFYGYLSDPRRGDLTIIIDIGSGQALRMSKHYYQTQTHTPKMMAEEMTDWFTLMDELEKNNIPVVKVFRKKSQPPQFIVVKKENFLFRLSDLFVKGQMDLNNPALQNVDQALVRDALDQLIGFAAKTWMYENIGDFRYEQMGYNGQQWILFDVGDKHHQPLENFGQKFNSFSGESDDPYSDSPQGNFLPKKIRQDIDEAIKIQRNKARQNDFWITRKSGSTRYGNSNYLFSTITKEPLETGRIFHVKSGDPKTSTAPSYILDYWVEGRVSFKIISLIKRGDRFSSYQVQLKNGSTAILKFLNWNSEENIEQLQKKVKKLKRDNDADLIGFGTDFILLKS